MAAIKRQKIRRDDQPALFGQPVEPVVIVETANKSKEVSDRDSVSTVINNKGITTETEETQADEPQPTGIQSSSRSSYRKPTIPIGVVVSKIAGAVLDIEQPEETLSLIDSGNYCVQSYVARSLHVVVIGGCVWDMPDSILVRFTHDEGPQAPSRECFLLTLDLYETILEKCGAAELAFAAGGMEDVNYRIMCHRMKGEHGVEAMARRYAKAMDFSRWP